MCSVALNICSWRCLRQHLAGQAGVWNRKWPLGRGDESFLLPWAVCCLGAMTQHSPHVAHPPGAIHLLGIYLFLVTWKALNVTGEGL